jgi:hypothetical protein
MVTLEPRFAKLKLTLFGLGTVGPDSVAGQDSDLDPHGSA